ncbi:Pheromone alpha factor receptor [Hanseniaspora uvarum DSM 2768]|nr:Pheromone alpha factor receptor [Hanseniaspora uvarum DSM 2768]GMM41261.1 alpha-factor pheromone receptor [Hanseniaspora uvarum]
MSSINPAEQLVPDYFNTTFNPSDIILTYESAFSLETTITFGQLQQWVESKLKYAIIYGTRIGAAGVAFLILLIVTKNKKSPIFVINIFSLLFIILHSGVYLKYLKSNYSSITYSFTYFEQMVKRADIYTSGAANMLEVFLVFFVELSLVFQVYTIFKSTSNKRLGQAWITLSSGIGITTVGLYFASAIKTIKAVYNNTDYSGDATIYNAAIICLASSINFMTLLLIYKLAHAIKSRRFLGLKQFDSFHILLIMSSQSLIIPSILYILAYGLPAHDGTPSLQAIATLIVVLSLPLSSMWAGASNSHSIINTMNPNFTNGSQYDQQSFYSQGLSSAIHSRRNNTNGKRVGFEQFDDVMIDKDLAEYDQEYYNQQIETPIDVADNPALHSAVPMEDQKD